MGNVIRFTRVNNDVNGNPRYVCHYLNLANDYDDAVKIAKKIGGKKFHTKQYGRGIVFQSYDIKATEKRIIELVKI
jgi:hypothetical protein